MFRGVIDLNVNFLHDWEFPHVLSHYAFRQMGSRTTREVVAPAHIPPLYAALPCKIAHQDFFTSRSIQPETPPLRVALQQPGTASCGLAIGAKIGGLILPLVSGKCNQAQ